MADFRRPGEPWWIVRIYDSTGRKSQELELPADTEAAAIACAVARGFDSKYTIIAIPAPPISSEKKTSIQTTPISERNLQSIREAGAAVELEDKRPCND
jgi:hypothetical protein